MVTLTVGGIQCEGCAAAVEAAVKRAFPDSRTTVDLATRTVRIEGVDDPTAARRVVESAGFDL